MTLSKTEVEVRSNCLLEWDRKYVETVAWCLFLGHVHKKKVYIFQWPMVKLECLKLHLNK